MASRVAILALYRSYFVAGAAAAASDIHTNALRILQFSVTSNTWNLRNAALRASVRVVFCLRSHNQDDKARFLWFCGGLPFTEDTTEPFSGIFCAFFPGTKLLSGI